MMPKFSVFAIMFGALAGCSATLPKITARQPVAAHWQNAAPRGTGAADPSWWKSFGDPTLLALQDSARAHSPTLASAAAALLAAQAQARQSAAGLGPSAKASVQQLRGGTLDTPHPITNSSTNGSLNASWEIDLFSKARQQLAASRDLAAAAQADLAGAHVALAATVADDYVQLRACRLTEAEDRAAVASQSDTIKATRALAAAGLGAPSDLALARASAASARITLARQQATCAGLAQSLAVAVGVPYAQIAPRLRAHRALPRPATLSVRAVPADLLHQRPDIAAARARFAAALAQAKVAQASRYPSLSLSGAITASLGTTTWQFGPGLSLPLFDGGALRATATQAQAQAVEAAQSYRSAVLSGVADVERALANLSAARRERRDAVTALAQYRSYYKAIDENWRAGGESLLNREAALRQLQGARITLISIREAELRDWIALYQALGGGWSAVTPPAPHKPEAKKT